MSIGVNFSIGAFREIARGDSAVVGLGKSNTLQGQGQLSAMFGKAISWLSGADNADAHKATKYEFMKTLQDFYGAETLKRPAVAGLLNRMADDAKPLSAYTVRQILNTADTAVKPQHKLGIYMMPRNDAEKSTEVWSAFKGDVAKMGAAAKKFGQHLDFNTKQAPLLYDMVRYREDPNPALAAKMAREGGAELARFALTFGRNDAEDRMLAAAKGERLQANCAAFTPQQNATTIVSACELVHHGVPATVVQLTHKLLMAGNPEEVRKAGEKVLADTRKQIGELLDARNFLKDPRITEGVSREDVAVLQQLRTRVADCLDEMSHPDGPYQQLIALAAMSTQDPSNLRALQVGAAPARPSPAPVTTGSVLTSLSLPVMVRAGQDKAFVQVNSAYKDETALYAAADKFLQHIDSKKKEAPLTEQMMLYINRGNPEVLEELRTAKADDLIKFAEAYKLGDQVLARMDAGQDPAIKTNIDRYMPHPFDDKQPSSTPVVAAVMSTSQIPTRLVAQLNQLLKAPNAIQANGISREILKTFPGQIENLQHAVKTLSHEVVSIGVSDNTKALVHELIADFESRVKEMADPDGLFQQILAFAATAAQNPEAFVAAMSPRPEA
jgi:hypothetical protein